MLKQRFIDGKTSYEVYQEATEQLEMKHLMTLSNLYEQGSKEQEQAQSALQEKLFQNQRKHQKDIQEKEKEEAERLRRETEKQKEKSDEYYAQIKQEKYNFSKDNGRNPVLEFQMLGFVMPNSHACKGSYRTAQYGKYE